MKSFTHRQQGDRGKSSVALLSGNIPKAMIIICNDSLLSRATNINKYRKPYGLFQTEYKKISFNS